MQHRRLRSPKNCGGFTLVELLIALVVGLIVLAAVFSLLDSQSRLYSLQRETTDARESLRAGGALLGWELMSASATGGDLYAIGPTSLSLRSPQGMGVVCARTTVGSAERFGLQQVSGYFEATADDSALVYSRGADAWNVLKVSAAWNGSAAWSGGGTPVCFWGDSTTSVPRPQAAVELQGDSLVLAGLTVGAPLTAFRRTEYALFQQSGRWWLGRRVGGAVPYDILTGPMVAPPSNGLAFAYYDATGAATVDPTQVAQVDIVLRAESFGQVRIGAAAGIRTVSDSLSTTAFLRNNAAP